MGTLAFMLMPNPGLHTQRLCPHTLESEEAVMNSMVLQVDSLIDEYFNSGDLQEASTSVQVML